MLKTKVIASSIANLTDARYFAAWGVDAIGFDIAQVSVMQVNALREWISGPEIIGQFSGILEQEAIQDIADRLELDIIQLDAFADSNLQLKQPIYREFLLGHDLPEKNPSLTLILKSENPSFVLSDHIDEVKQICNEIPCYLDLNIGTHELDTVIQDIKPEGIVLRGGDEEKVGFKSFDELDEIMEALAED